MPQFDWQAYLDGGLSPDERAGADSLLKSEEWARRELDGLNTLRAALKQASLHQTPDSGRAERVLSGLSRSAPSRARWVFGFAVTVLVIIGAFLGWRAYTFDPFRLDLTAAREIVPMSSPQVAAQWVRTRTSFPAPTLPLGGRARIVGSRYGDGWACYDYEIDGVTYYLYMSPRDSFTGDILRSVDGARLYVAKGIGWRAGDLSFYLRGGSEKERISLAIVASREIERQL